MTSGAKGERRPLSRIDVRLPPAVLAEVQRLAEAQGVTVAAFTRQALNLHLDRSRERERVAQRGRTRATRRAWELNRSQEPSGTAILAAELDPLWDSNEDVS